MDAEPLTMRTKLGCLATAVATLAAIVGVIYWAVVLTPDGPPEPDPEAVQAAYSSSAASGQIRVIPDQTTGYYELKWTVRGSDGHAWTCVYMADDSGQPLRGWITIGGRVQYHCYP